MEIINKTKQHIAEIGISQSKLAKEAGINAGALSAYLNGNYQGDIANVEAKLAAYFEKKKYKHESLWKHQRLLKQQLLAKFSRLWNSHSSPTVWQLYMA